MGSGVTGMMAPVGSIPRAKFDDEERRRRAGSQGLLRAVGEPLSYAPGVAGAIGSGMLGAQYLTGEKSEEEGLSALAMLTGLANAMRVPSAVPKMIGEYGAPKPLGHEQAAETGMFGLTRHGRAQQGERYTAAVGGYMDAVRKGEHPKIAAVLGEIEAEKLAAKQRGQVADERALRHLLYKLDDLRNSLAAGK